MCLSGIPVEVKPSKALWGCSGDAEVQVDAAEEESESEDSDGYGVPHRSSKALPCLAHCQWCMELYAWLERGQTLPLQTFLGL